jgi:hypothetical protein
MQTMQHLTHKLGLSIQAKNGPLAAFYLEEVEETAEVIEKKFPTYDGKNIGVLTETMFLPSIEPLEKSVGASNWAASATGYSGLIDSCNKCHTATEHGFVEITVPAGNPFNQTFSPQ